MTNKKMSCDCNVVHEEKVKRAKQKMCDENIVKGMTKFYKAFADETRLKIINALYTQEMCVCDISCLLNMTKSAVSHQLGYLRNIGLIKCKRNGKEVIYDLLDRHVKDIFEVSKEHIMEKYEKDN